MISFGKSPAHAGTSDTALAEPAGAEQRRSRRIRTSLRTGQLYDMRNNFLADCQVRDRSTGGAKLRLLSNLTLPPHFKFHDDVECTLIEVELRWRNKNEIGVKFAGPWEEGLPSAKE